MKKMILPLLCFTALSSCKTTGNKSETRAGEDDVEEVDTVEIPEHALYDAYKNEWYGPGSERLNKAWVGHAYLDTTGDREWKWSISDKEKSKMSPEDIRIVDSLLNDFNN